MTPVIVEYILSSKEILHEVDSHMSHHQTDEHQCMCSVYLITHFDLFQNYDVMKNCSLFYSEFYYNNLFVKSTRESHFQDHMIFSK